MPASLEPAVAVVRDPFNQVPPLADDNPFATDIALREAVVREGAAHACDFLHERGAEIGAGEMRLRAELANRYPPRFVPFDGNGHRLDHVEFHPAYHELMDYLARHGVSSAPWARPGPGAHVARAALFTMLAQVEGGALCPTTMTFAAVPALRLDADLAATWLPRVFAARYDPRFVPAHDKAGVTLGMGMTERQGGSDVRTNTTRAEPAGGRNYVVTGHKWFLSAPMSDAFLVLAQAPGGLSCFLLPRFRPDGSVNALRLLRLKDKLGDRSNASAEVEFERAHAELVGDEGRGIATILAMGHLCRLDCVLGTTGLMRSVVVQALHHARQRQAFGRALAAQPLMQAVLADLALESEAATVLALRLAHAFDADDDASRSLRRLVTPAAKFWICKRGPLVAAEAMEVLGGNGYVEEAPLARMYRQMPVNSIWEGSGNVVCLDVLRAIGREPACVDALAAELAAARGGDTTLDAFAAALLRDLVHGAGDEAAGRGVTQRIAVALQAALLVRHAPAAVAGAFCASRLASQAFGGAIFGTAPGGAASEIIRRAFPAA
ncbi:MAG: isovaleryl-CoA dehydrogenase [Burkholderiales bacterium]|nr:isovaleryl-CoA dehydrogenase [Burkholderiales bacterium]